MRNLTYGLLIEQTTKYGTEYVTARVIARETVDGVEADYPINPSDQYGEKLSHDGLGLYGHVYDDRLIGTEPTYQDVFAIDANKARKMAKTLDLIDRQNTKDGSRTAPEAFMTLARALKLKFVVQRKGGGMARSSYCDNQWRWMSIPDGKFAYEQLIREAVDATARKF